MEFTPGPWPAWPPLPPGVSWPTWPPPRPSMPGIEELMRKLSGRPVQWFWDEATQLWKLRPVPPITPPPVPPWWLRPIAIPGAGCIAVVLTILALIAVAFAIKEVFFTPRKEGVDPGPVCEGTGEDRITRVADVTVWGANSSHNAAIDEAWKSCAALRDVCTGTCPHGGTCQPKPHVINEEQFTVWVWEAPPIKTRTILEYNCQCTCV